MRRAGSAAVGRAPVTAPRSAADIPAVRTKWLLPGMLPAGRIVTVSGPSATGKSTFTAGLIGELTRAGRRVGLYSPEEVWAEDITPRLVVNEVDLSRVVELTMDHVHELNMEDGAREFVRVVQDNRLDIVVIDPITSAITFDPNKGEEVRRLLEILAGGCARYDFVLLLILHDRKGSAADVGPSADMVKGSQEWTAVPRVNLRIALDPATVGESRADVRRLVGPVATNLSGVLGCREALSVQDPDSGAWRWEWTTDDLGRGIEWEWAERERARVTVASAVGRAKGGASTAKVHTAGRKRAAEEVARLVESNRGISRKAVALALSIHPTTLQHREQYEEFTDLIRIEPAVKGTDGSYTATKYYLHED